MKHRHLRTRWPSLPRTVATRTLAALLGLSLVAPSVLQAQQPQPQPQPGVGRFRGGDPVTVNFVNADIEGVTRAMAAILKQQFVVDPRVKGTITLYSEDPLTPREAYLNFLAALRGLGFTVVESGGIFKVVPEADAKLQAGTVSVGGVTRRGDQVITQIFKLNHENANNLVPVLRPLISPNNTINANPGNNSLIITDYADNLQRIAKIIAATDTPAAGEVEVIPLEHAVAADIAQLVQRLTEPTPGAPVVPGMAAGGAASVLVDARSNSLLVRAPSPTRMNAIRSLVAKLDRPISDSNPLGNIWVVYLKNADAVKLAAVLRAAYGAGGATGAAGAAGTTPTAAPTAPAAQGLAGQTSGASPQATAPVAASPSPSTGGFVQADPATNSLIITAPEPMYRQLRAMIDQLDSRRAQVYIESMIVEVTGDNAADFGFQWQGLIGNEGDKHGLIGGTNFGTGGNNIINLALTAAGSLTGENAALPGPGLNVGLIRNYAGTYTLAAIARLLQSQANTNIVSTPNLVTLDNEEAKIIVGSNVPFITGQFTNTGTATTSPFQTIERKDVGITLRIRPQIGEGGTVRMQLFQESSSLSQQVAPGTDNAGPSTDKRSIESTVVVDDGQIIVLGGLIEDRYTDNRSKVPLLGDIPVVGALFRSENRTKRRTNLMVFLRPVVMRDKETTNKVSLDRYDLIRGAQEAGQPPRSIVVPINESPVLPPPVGVEGTTLPISPLPSAPGAPANRPPPPAPSSVLPGTPPPGAPAN